LRGRAPVGRAQALTFQQVGASALGLAAKAATPTGKIVLVPGTSIRVDASIADNVERLIRDARAAGISLNGSGYRSSMQQAQLRIKNRCTCRDRSDCCSPPTAPVGKSQHEVGLAIDFTTGGRSVQSNTAAYRWLVANAAKYGLINLPGEPWHWSTTGK
jgi:LAS superfamily LD-carboxypeptidase LdcB